MEIIPRLTWILLFSLYPTAGFAGWTYLSSEVGDGNAIVDVSMANERVACAVGMHKPGGSMGNTEPLLLCTKDGGGEWQKVNLDSGMLIPSAVYLVNENLGFIGAVKISGFQVDTKIYRTGDGFGWNEVSIPGEAHAMVSDLFFSDKDHGWAATGDGLMKTDDGGQTWSWAELPEIGEGRLVEGVFFVDAQKGWVVGGQPYREGDEWTDPVPACCGFILGTVDGGLSWDFLQDGLPGEVHRIAFYGEQDGLAAGGGGDTGLLMRSEDGGNTWTAIAIPEGQYGVADYIMDIAWSGSEKAWAIGNIADGNPMVFASSDSALSFTVDDSYQSAFDGLSGFEAFVKFSMLTAISFPIQGRGMICGKNALLVGYMGDGFCPDMDADGHQDVSCGGDDCDDQNRYVNPSAGELCNGLDENCDGEPDESFDLNTDHENCGECGFGCQPAQVCWDGQCTMDCPDGLLRCDQECADTSSSIFHCGTCDNRCCFDHAAASCDSGKCMMGACEDGWVDLDGNESNGCEYFCLPSASATETCNGLDDDCDGNIDEGLDCDGQLDGGTDAGTSQGDASGLGEEDPGFESNGCGCTTGTKPGKFITLMVLLMIFLSVRTKHK